MYKLGLRAIRLAALALITLPEPVTTGIGVAALVGTCFLAKKQEDKVLKRFERVLKDHLIQTGRLEHTMPISHHQEEKEQQHLLNLNAGVILNSNKSENRFETGIQKKFEYHSVYIPIRERNHCARSYLQPLSQESFDKYAPHNYEIMPAEKLIHHKLDISQVTRRYQIKKPTQTMNRQRGLAITCVYDYLQGSPKYATSLAIGR
jgi:hypothetical protein